MVGPDARVVTVPNAISLARLACVPVFLWLLWSRDEAIAAALLFAVLGASDWVDGYVARHFDQGSELGKILDPTADRVLLVAGAVALLTEDMPGAVDALLVVVLVREVLIAAVTVGLALAGARRIDVVWAGKAGTLALMFALPLLLVAERAGSDAVATLAALSGWAFALGGIALGYYAALKYVPAARVALRDGRAARLAEVDA